MVANNNKVVGTIVNSKMLLIGLMMEMTDAQMGIVSTNKEKKITPVSMSALAKMKFENRQIAVRDGMNIAEKGEFKLRDLQMYFMSENGQMVQIDNRIKLIKKYVCNAKIVGFDVAFGAGGTLAITYDNIIRLQGWFKPDNFTVRTGDKGSYICGKGTRIEDLPTEYISGKAQKPKGKSTNVEDPVYTKLEALEDVTGLYKVIRELEGKVVILPDEEYKAHTIAGIEKNDEFKKFMIGEIGSPYLSYNPVKLTANTLFKQGGVVKVEFNGGTLDVPAYLNRTKSVFLRGENYIKRLGIIIPEANAERFKAALGKTLAVKEINTSKVIGEIELVSGIHNARLFEANTNKLELIVKKNREKSILSEAAVYELIKRKFDMNIISKALGAKSKIIADLKGEIGKEELSKMKYSEIRKEYRAYSVEQLEAIKEAGIDIYSGEFKKAASEKKSVENKNAQENRVDNEKLEIEYSIDGYDISKITGNAIVKMVQEGKEDSRISSKAIACIKEVLGYIEKGKVKSAYQTASDYYKKATQEIDKINEKLWMHETAMLIDSANTSIHTNNTSWERVENSRLKKGTMYQYVGKDAAGLRVKVSEITVG